MKLIVIVCVVFFLFAFGCSQGAVKEDASVKVPTENGKEVKENKEENDAPPPLPKEDVITNEFVGKTYVELSKLEVPVECDVAIESEEIGVVKMKLYMKGTAFRTESDVGYCKKAITIFNEEDKIMYTSCEGTELVPNCPWLKIDVKKYTDKSVSEVAGSTSYSSSELGKLPATSFTCKAGTFSDSFLAAPLEKVCDINDLAKKYEK